MSAVKVHNPRLRSVRLILSAAVERIANGWTRNTHRRDINGVPHFCAVGAIRSVSRDHDAEYRARTALTKTIGCGDILVYWNDDEKQTKRNVIKAFRKAIKNLTPSA